MLEEWQACAQAGRAYAGWGRSLQPNGRVVWWEVTTAPVVDGKERHVFTSRFWKQATLGAGRHEDAGEEHEEPSGPHRDGGAQPAPAREHAEDEESDEPVEAGEPGDGVDGEQGGDAAEIEAPSEVKELPEEPDPETGIEDGLEAGLEADPAEQPDPGA